MEAMSKRVVIDHYEPGAVMRGLLQGGDHHNRVGAACVYGCPRCSHRIRFRWRSFYQADGRTALPRKLRRHFDDLTPKLPGLDQGAIEFDCPGCGAPTRIIFSIFAKGDISFQFDLYAVLVGEGAHA